mmetsp:Transcript_109729/g.319039  ORF Transcript_109729/g.319039 Transcript_109729/m.319039 type:complete len:487 (+) Transcript_109729:413-1873(+)
MYTMSCKMVPAMLLVAMLTQREASASVCKPLVTVSDKAVAMPAQINSADNSADQSTWGSLWGSNGAEKGTRRLRSALKTASAETRDIAPILTSVPAAPSGTPSNTPFGSGPRSGDAISPTSAGDLAVPPPKELYLSILDPTPTTMWTEEGIYYNITWFCGMNASYAWTKPKEIWECRNVNTPGPYPPLAAPPTDDLLPPVPPVKSDEVGLEVYDANGYLYQDANHEMERYYSLLMNHGAAEGKWRVIVKRVMDIIDDNATTGTVSYQCTDEVEFEVKFPDDSKDSNSDLWWVYVVASVLLLGGSFFVWRSLQGRNGRDKGNRNAGYYNKLLEDNPEFSEALDKLQVCADDFVVDMNTVELEEMVGFGATAHVFRGKMDGKLVAVKRLPYIEQLSSIIISEGEALVRLNHPTVVRFYGFGVDTTYAYIICEFCHGSLDRLLAGALGSWALGYEGRMAVVLNTNPQSACTSEQNLLNNTLYDRLIINF